MDNVSPEQREQKLIETEAKIQTRLRLMTTLWATVIVGTIFVVAEIIYRVATVFRNV